MNLILKVKIEDDYKKIFTEMYIRYSVDIIVDQYIRVNSFSKKRNYIVRVMKNGNYVDEQTGPGLDHIIDMLNRRLKTFEKNA